MKIESIALSLVIASSPPAAASALCTLSTNAEILTSLEKNSQETLKFVGMSDNYPIEVIVSDKGTWSILIILPNGICFMAAGTNWQAVEAKLPGIEN